MAQNFDTILDNIDLENSKLSDLFDKAWKSQQGLYKASDESTVDYQERRKKTIQVLEQCKYMIDELALFSENESIEEISTSELRYFLIEALLGWLIYKANTSKPELRLQALRKSHEHYFNFMQQTGQYEIHKYNLNRFKLATSTSNSNSSGNEEANGQSSKQAAFDNNLIHAAEDRSEKIRRYKEQKEIESQLDKMMLVVSSAHTDDEQKRKFYTTFITYWVNKAVDELKLLSDEIQILSRFENGQGESHRAEGAHGHAHNHGAHSKSEVKKPFIIAKSQMQAQVFGLGYPSVPVYSIDQFYDQLQDQGFMPSCGVAPESGPVQIGGGVTETQKDKEKADKDLLEDMHDEETLRKEREWDEFKDDNKRGSGNRHNRS